MANVEIDVKPPTFEVDIRTSDGRQLDYLTLAYVPAVGDTIELKVMGRFERFTVLGRIWDLTADVDKPMAELRVTHVES